jgi:CubicO group peptidase (beta-lactamase class C family)
MFDTFENFRSRLSTTPLSSTPIFEGIDEAKKALDKFVSENQISSYVCYIYKKGQPVFTQEENANMNSVFGIGSVSKGIDKIAIMKLVEMGKLKLSDKILQFGIDEPKDGINLVNYYDWYGWDAITIEHLMKHTSGIPDIINEIPEFNYHYGEYGKDPDPDKLKILRAVSKYPLFFKAGAEERYSNTNFWLIGKIIEHVTKKPYGAAIKELIFDPVGMENTYWAYESTSPPGLVKSYVKDLNTGKLIKKFPIKPFDAWAIFYSTPGDMKKLAEAYLGNQIISKKTRDSFFDSTNNSPGQLGAIHDGFTCFWDVLVDQDCYYCFMINVFGQDMADKLIEAATEVRESVGIKVS